MISQVTRKICGKNRSLFLIMIIINFIIITITINFIIINSIKEQNLIKCIIVCVSVYMCTTKQM